MNSRQRVLAALNFQQPDRVPIDFGGHRSSGISGMAYARLRKALGLPDRPIKIYDVIQQLAVIDDDVLDRFGVDTIELGRGFALSDSAWREWRQPDGSPCLVPEWILPERREGAWVVCSKSGRPIAKMPDGALYFEQCYWPYADGRTDMPIGEALGEVLWAALASPPGPEAADPQKFAEGARALRERTDRAVLGLFGGNLLEIGQFLFRIDGFMMLLAGEPERAHDFLDRLVEFHLGNLERYLKAVGPYLDVIVFGDDLGMQNGPQMSPRMYREFFKPRHAAMWKRAKELANVKVMLHCCGGVRELLPDLIDAGLDAINPVQITCRGMSAAELKRDFAGRITFWGGGCDTRHVLPCETPDDVRRHVREQVAILSPGGGFVFQQVHNVLANVPPENIIAMFDAVRTA